MERFISAIQNNDISIFTSNPKQPIPVYDLNHFDIVRMCLESKAYDFLKKLIKSNTISIRNIDRGFIQLQYDITALQILIDTEYYDTLMKINFINGIMNVEIMKLMVEKIVEHKQQHIFDTSKEGEYPIIFQAITNTVELLEWWLNYMPTLIKWFNTGFGHPRDSQGGYKNCINNDKYVSILIKHGLKIKPHCGTENGECPLCTTPECLNLLYKCGTILNIDQKLKITDTEILREFQKSKKLIHYRNPYYVKMLLNDIDKSEEKRMKDEEWIDYVKNDKFDEIVKIKDNTTINNYDKYGKTALIYSIEQRKSKFTRYLITKGANVNIGGQIKNRKIIKYTRAFHNNCGRMPSYFKSLKQTDYFDKEFNEKEEIKIKSTIECKETENEDDIIPNVFEKCRYGVYPIMYAIENCDIQIIELLIDNGADLLIIDDEGIDVMGYVYKCQGIAQKDMRDLIKPLFDEVRRSSRKTPKQKLMERLAEALEHIKDDDVVDQVKAQNEAIGFLLETVVKRPV